MNIHIHISTMDGLSESKRFKSLVDARKFAQRYVGKHPEMGGNYAVSPYGDAKAVVRGVTLKKLFASPGKTPTECQCDYNEETGKSYTCEFCRLPSTIAYRNRARKRDARARIKEYHASEEKARRDGTWLPF